MMKLHALRPWALALAVASVCGCGFNEGRANTPTPATRTPTGTPNRTPTASQTPTSTPSLEPTTTPTSTPVVHAGQSIQAAIDAAAPNSVITVEPGVYHEPSGGENALTITIDGLQLIGLSTPGNPVVIEKTAGQINGIWVSPADTVGAAQDELPPCGTSGTLIHGFTLQGFTLRGFDQFGVYLACNDGYTLDANVADSSGFYGFFPVRSHNGVVSNNEAFNTSKDAAIYVGQSDHITVTGNRSHDSLIGIEVENSADVTVSGNETYNDTIGLLADEVPDVQQEGQSNVTFSDNNVHDNNRPNTGVPPDFTSVIPSGTGILDSSGTNITVQGNTVSNNNFGGIVIASYFTPFPTNVRILDNTLSGNGLQPPSDPALAAFAADLTWDGQGTGICASGNTAATTKVQSKESAFPVCQ